MAEIVEVSWTARAWSPTETAGIDYSVLRDHGAGGATFLLRFGAGVVGLPHTHPEGEELFVVSGDITIGGRRLKTGDYLYTPPNEAHDARAHDVTILFLNAPKLPVFL